jgi:hypothetical protein
MTPVKRVKTCARAGGKAPGGSTTEGFRTGAAGLRSAAGEDFTRLSCLARDVLAFFLGWAPSSKWSSEDEDPGVWAASEPDSSDEVETEADCRAVLEGALGFFFVA